MANAKKIDMSDVYTAPQLKKFALQNGQNFFSPEAMESFDSRILPMIVHVIQANKPLLIFITSESVAPDYKRGYTIRSIEKDGTMSELSLYQEFKTSSKAYAALSLLLQGCKVF